MRDVAFVFALTVLAGAAMAQPAAPPPPNSGICVLDREEAIAKSRLGRAEAALLKQIVDQAKNGYAADEAPILAQTRALADEQASLSRTQLKARVRALAMKARKLRSEGDHDLLDAAAKRDRIEARVSEIAEAAFQDVYRARGCGLLLERRSGPSTNRAKDVTAAAIQSLDARFTTLTLDPKG
jgi:Skp family chaperone for outer membrane proteins